MDRAETDRLVQRLVADPHDEEALAHAHRAGEDDPKAYAMLLERVGTETRDPAYAAHWLSEAANVWSTTLADAHKAARVLMLAIDRDPTAAAPAERLSQLYRDKGDIKALVALLDRRAKALAPLAAKDPELRGELAGMHEELGRLWADAPLSQPRKAVENYKRATELDPTSAYAIYNARELYKQLEDYESAIPLYGAELLVERDPARRIGLLRDEAATRKLASDLIGATRALAAARELDSADPALQQEFASSVLDRIQAGEAVPTEEREHAASLLVALAETYEGEHGLAYAGAALDIEAGNDRGIQLFVHHARALGQEGEIAGRCNAYLQANPGGEMDTEVRSVLTSVTRMQVEAHASGEENSSTPGTKKMASERAGKRAGAEPPTLTASDTGIPGSLSAKRPGLGATPSISHSPSAAPGPIENDSDVGFAGGRKPSIPAEKLQGILDAAQMLAGKGKKPEAFAKYKEVLEADAAHPEALGWAEDYLRSKRDYGQLRDVLLASIRATANVLAHLESRKERLREVAGLCEGQLRDVDGAIAAWRQLLAADRTDESARTALMRLLEKSQRWDELANLLEQEATIESEIDSKVMLEKRLARLQEDKRKDFVGAGEAWARIARMLTDDDQAFLTASRLFEKGERADLAAGILSESAANISDPVSRGQLMQRLAELREELGDGVLAADAYADAADALRNGKLWEEADRLYSASSVWQKAAHAAHQRGLLTGDLKQQAMFFARAADYLMRAKRPDEALERLEEATDLDPLNDDYASLLVTHYNRDDHTDKLVSFLTKRGDRLTDRTKRLNIRREAAALASSRLGDRELSRELWLKLLEDGDDKEALERLIDDAVEREDHTEAATLLRRLGQNTADKAERARVALREAELLAEGVGDIDTAISRYELILAELDPTCRPALQAIADLEEARGSLGASADALERELKLVADIQERGTIAARLARNYEKLEDPKNAIRALDLVRKADLENFDALTRLCELCEMCEQWARVAELLVERIEIEADQQEIVELTKKLANVLATKLDRGDEALGTLTDLADQGEPSVRAAYIELGDRLGWKGIVAGKLKDWWFDARHGAQRTEALRGAFERFAEVGRDADAVTVAIELVRTKGADRTLAAHLEELAVKTTDEDALSVAHELVAREVSGDERARELVRQAEVRVRAGLARDEAIQHGEHGLAFIAPANAEPLLERLAALAAKPAEVIDLYERQVTRSRAPADRVRALARAAQVASLRGQPERARSFFELALSGAPSDDTVNVLDQAARDGDKYGGGDRMRRALCQAMAAGGHGARDGGRTRANLLRRAATIAHRDLHDIDQAFSWLADALVAHVDSLTLDMLEGLGIDSGTPRRAEAALSHALGEVFDGPLVRQLLARRAKIRRDQLVEPVNAAADLKKLHDLSPADQAVMDELAGLLTELGDYKALVQLFEDSILRGKDMNARAELARKVARVWEEQLADAREAADAWRRVLRMKAGDAEATGGLERAKSGKLKKLEGDPKVVYAPPKISFEAGELAAKQARRSVPPPSEGGKKKPGARSSAPPPLPPNASKEETAPYPRAPSAPDHVAVKAPSVTAPPGVRARASAAPLPTELLRGNMSTTAEAPSADGAAMTFRGIGPGQTAELASIPDNGPREPFPSFNSEFEASFDRLAMEEPASTKSDPGPPTQEADRPDISFEASSGEVTASAQVVPYTIRGAQSVDKPVSSGEPTTVARGPKTALGPAADLVPAQELGSDELIEADTGVGIDAFEGEATLAQPQDDDEIVIADDLAEVDEERPDGDATDLNVGVPAKRPEP